MSYDIVFVVNKPEHRDLLNKAFDKSGDLVCEAVCPGNPRYGWITNKIVLLNENYDAEWFDDWFTQFKCCLAPKGVIL